MITCQPQCVHVCCLPGRRTPSPAGVVRHREMALELVCRADVGCNRQSALLVCIDNRYRPSLVSRLIDPVSHVRSYYMASSSSATVLPADKRRRLSAELANAAGTKVGAARVLKLLNDQGFLGGGLSVTSQKGVQTDARLGIEAVCGVATPYGKLIVDLKLHDITVEIVNPFAYLHVLSERSAPLYEELFPDRRNNAAHTIIIYIDEIRPGNPLRPGKGRMTQSVYWTCSDFPDHVLCRSDCWFLLTTVRSIIIEKVRGKVSGFMRALLHVFWGASGTSFSTGVVLSNGNDTGIMTASFDGFLADEKALKEIWCLKGASGSRCCINCTNLIQFLSDADRHGTCLQGLSCYDMSLFRMTTDEEVFRMADSLKTLHDGGCTKVALARLEQILGMTYDADGILYDEHLRTILKPVRMYIRDWMHTVVGHGVAGTQVAAVLAKMKTNGIKPESVQLYLNCFALPLAHGPVHASWFDKNNICDDHMKCFASEMLSIVVLFNEFLQDVVMPQGLMQDDCRCFALLARIVQLLKAGPSVAGSRYADMHEMIVEHHRLYVELYPTYIKPKWHHMLHLQDHGRDSGKILSCFVTERKHKKVKAAATWNFRNFEHSVIRTLVFQQIDVIVQENLFKVAYLENPHAFVANGVQVIRATHATLRCGQVKADDVIACRTSTGRFVAKVMCFFSMYGDDHIDVMVSRLLPELGCERTWSAPPCDSPSLVSALDVTSAVIYANRGGGRVRIVPPLGW